MLLSGLWMWKGHVFDDLFRRDRLNKTLERTAASMAVPSQSQRTGLGVSAFFAGIGRTSHFSRPLQRVA